MKKIFLMLALIGAVISANAQIATENSKFFDNVSVGVTAGVSAPLDFNSVFPLNTNLGLKIQKDITPVVGLQIEGLAILNDNHFSDLSTVVKATNVGLNGVINLSNLLGGYKGTPRVFEISTVTGLGWLHNWDTPENSLTAKTGLDLAFNLGKSKAHSLVLTPAVYWNLHKFEQIAFDKRGAQLALNLTYAYHFKTSNGTRHFKTYDVGAMGNEIEVLTAQLEASRKNEAELENALKAAAETAAIVATAETKVVTIVKPNKWVVQFAQNSSVLTDEAKVELDGITEGTNVTVVGSASPEGAEAYNQRLSEQRAATVADYLTKRGVTVTSCSGVGASGNASNRLAVVTVTE